MSRAHNVRFVSQLELYQEPEGVDILNVVDEPGITHDEKIRPQAQ